MIKKEHFNLTMASQNRKLGPMPTTFGPRTTCPDSCPLKANGCYASAGYMNMIWNRVDKGEAGTQWPEFLKTLKTIESGRIWRYGTTGDLPGHKDVIDTQRLQGLVDANRGKMGYTYTHYPMTKAANRSAVRKANDGGFVINVSANSLDQADRLSKYGLPMVALVPKETPNTFVTKQGLHGIVCPAQTSHLTCQACKLCARSQRATCAPGTPGSPIIGFRAHGGNSGAVERVIAVAK